MTKIIEKTKSGNHRIELLEGYIRLGAAARRYGIDQSLLSRLLHAGILQGLKRHELSKNFCGISEADMERVFRPVVLTKRLSGDDSGGSDGSGGSAATLDDSAAMIVEDDCFVGIVKKF